jgi:hypothetical protein
LGAAVVAASGGSGDTGSDDISRAQTQNKGRVEGHLKPEVPRPRGHNEEAPQVQPERERRSKPPRVEKRRPRGRVRPKREKSSRGAAKADVDVEDDAGELLRRSSNLETVNGEERSVSPLMTHATVVRISPRLCNCETDPTNITP